MDNIDAIIRLDQLSIPVPAPRDIAGRDFTVQLDWLTQQHSYVLQVLVHLERLYWKSEKWKSVLPGNRQKF